MSDALLIEIGAPYDPDTANPAFTNHLLDQTTDAVEFIFQAPAGIAITKLGFRYGAKSSGTPPTYIIELEGVAAATGFPDGTIKGASNNAKATFRPPADTSWDGTWQWITLGESYTCAEGEWLAIVIKDDPGTADSISGTNSGSFTYTDGRGGNRSGLPYAITNAAGSRTKQAAPPVFGYASSSVTYGRPVEAVTTLDLYSSGTNPNEQGMTFTLPAGWGSTYKIRGVKYYGAGGTTGTTSTMTLYDDDGDPGTALQTLTIDWDMVRGTGGTLANFTFYFDESSLTAIDFGSAYHIGLKADGGTTAMSLASITLDAAADRAAWPGGEQFNLCTRNGGTWTEVTAKRPLMNLILSDITEPAGGGGNSNADILRGSVIA